MTVRVQSPVEGYSGLVGSVAFVNGEGETDDANMLAYFTRKGYLLGDVERPVADEGDEPESESDDELSEGTGGFPLDPPQPRADEDGFGGDAPDPADDEDDDEGDEPESESDDD